MTQGTRSDEESTSRRARALLFAFVAALAVLPSLGTLGAPLLADDGAILGNVARRGTLADLWGPQYGLELIRFWRPLVSWSWSAQLATTGVDPLPLRLCNLVGHVLTAACAAWIVLRLRGPWVAAFACGALVALFPHQGGNVTWVAGRTEVLCGLFLCLSGAVALGPRPSLAAVPALLACASKETGFAVVAWIVLLRWAAGDSGRALVRSVRVPVALVVLCFLCRALALGSFVGGYGSGGATLGGLGSAARALAPNLGLILVLTLGLIAIGAWTKGLQVRLAVAGLGIAAAGFAPYLPTLFNGVLEAQNVRYLFAGEAGLALAAAAGLFGVGNHVHALGTRAALALLATALVLRGLVAWQDTHEWAAAGRVAEERVAAARALVAAESPSVRPVLFDGFPATWQGAYCLGFGAVDRLRAPFEATPRPVWPLRPLFGAIQSEREPSRSMVALPGGGSLWPWRDAGEHALAVTVDGAELTELVLAENDLVADSGSQTLRVSGRPEGTFLEWIAYTEMGYEPALWPAAPGVEPVELSVRNLLLLSNGLVSLGQTLLQSADAGAARAYLELRAVDESGRVRATAAWIEVTWPPELIAFAAQQL